MRNLKRALSLAVASVMLLGMMVVGSGAASYADVTSEDNQEAIEVLQAVGVMVGDDQGNFNPDQQVTRGEMAVIMSNLLDLSIGTYSGAVLPFTDVPAWAHDYVAACYANGITGGTSATTYGTDEPVTAVQAGLMMMKALGYFQNQEDFSSGWVLSTITQAARIDLYDGIDAGTEEPLTRNEVAQLALNTLKSDLVDFTGTLGIQVGDVTVGYRAEYTPRTSSSSLSEAIIDETALYPNLTSNTIQLGEDLYHGDLRLYGSVDGMGRPSNEWVYDYEAIGTYAVEPDHVVVVDKNQTLAEEIEDLNRNYDLSYTYVSGSSSTPVATDVYLNGDDNGSTPYSGTLSLVVGDVLEIYMRDGVANFVDTVSVTRYSVDRLTGDAATRDEGDDMEVRLPGVIGWTAAEDVVGYQGLVDDDVVYFYQDNNGVYYFAAAESFDGELTAINNKTPNTYEVSGSTYTANGSMSPAAMNMTSPVFNTLYRFWTDDNGYVIYGEELEDALSDYVIIQDIEYVANTGVDRTGTVQARLVKMDGTVEVQEIESITTGAAATDTYVGIGSGNANEDVNSDGNRYLALTGGSAKINEYLTSNPTTAVVNQTFFTYEVNTDGSYDLTYVHGSNIVTDTRSGVQLEAGRVTAGGTNIGVNDNTIFVINDEENATQNDYDYTAYTGKNNAPDLQGATISYVREGGVVTHMYINTYTDRSFSGDYVFFLKNSPERYETARRDDGTTYGYNVYLAVVSGEAGEVYVRANEPNNNLANGGNNNITGAAVTIGLFEPTYNSDGVITELTAGGAEAKAVDYGYMVEGTSLYTDKNGDNGAQYGETYWFENDAPAYVMDEDDNVESTYVENLDADSNDRIYVVTADTTGYEVEFVVVLEQDVSDRGIELVGVTTLSAPNNNNGETQGTAIQYTGTGSGTIQIVADDAVQITAKFDSNAGTAWTSMSNTNEVSVSGHGYIAIDVTESDGSHTFYWIEMN